MKCVIHQWIIFENNGLNVNKNHQWCTMFILWLNYCVNFASIMIVTRQLSRSIYSRARFYLRKEIWFNELIMKWKCVVFEEWYRIFEDYLIVQLIFHLQTAYLTQISPWLWQKYLIITKLELPSLKRNISNNLSWWSWFLKGMMNLMLFWSNYITQIGTYVKHLLPMHVLLKCSLILSS